jgi:hypothetical protein
MQNDQIPDSSTSFRDGINWLGFAASGLAFGAEVFLRRRFGERYIGAQGLVPVAGLFFLPLFFPHDDPMPALWLMGAYLCMCLVARCDIVRRQRLGDLGCHSRYSGEPRLWRLVPLASETTVKSMVEPMIVAGLGCLALQFSQPVGAYVLASAFALFIMSESLKQRDRNLRLDLHDAVMDAQFRAGRFRSVG